MTDDDALRDKMCKELIGTLNVFSTVTGTLAEMMKWLCAANPEDVIVQEWKTFFLTTQTRFGELNDAMLAAELETRQ